MKRYFAMLLAVCLLLCACGKQEPAPTDAPTQPTTQATEPATKPTDPPTEPTEPPVLYRHPLTGAPLSEPWNGQITAIMMNNLKKAMPQCGVSAADIIYEIEVEGDITRNLALFTDFTGIEAIGPIRSARTAFNSVAVSFDAPLVHCGGSQGLALAGRYGSTADKIDNWEHIDQAYNGKYFYRDSYRSSIGYAWEHTLFTTGELMQQALDAKGYNTPTENTYGLRFDKDIDLDGQPANEVTVKFKGGKTTKFTYNADKKNYTMYQHGQDHIDGNTGEVLTFKNVIAIYTKQWYHSDGMHKFYDTIGSGDGYAAINGEIVPINWSRESLRTPYTYTLEDGTPLTLDVGTSYVAVVGIKHDIAYQ